MVVQRLIGRLVSAIRCARAAVPQNTQRPGSSGLSRIARSIVSGGRFEKPWIHPLTDCLERGESALIVRAHQPRIARNIGRRRRR